MVEFLSHHYYGVDILSTTATFIGIYYLGNRKRVGFIMTCIGNILWLTFGIMTGSLGLIVANVGLAALNIRAYFRWKKSNQTI